MPVCFQASEPASWPPHGWGGGTYSIARYRHSRGRCCNTGILKALVMKTFVQQTLAFGEDESPSSREASPVNPSPWPDSDAERKITVSSGLRCCELYPKSSPLMSLVKTLLASSRMYSPVMRLKWVAKPLYSEKVITRKKVKKRNGGCMSWSESVETLSERDIPSNRLLYQLVPSVRHTGETGYGLLPTVTTQEVEHPSSGVDEKGRRWTNTAKTSHSMCLADMAEHQLLPTPNATMGARGGQHVDGKLKTRPSGVTYASNLNDLAASGLLPTPQTQGLKVCDEEGQTRFVDLNLLPTPTAIEGQKWTNTWNPHSQMGQSLSAMAGSGLLPVPKDSQPSSGGVSRLSPLFVEEMMGFPSMYIVLPFLTPSNGEEEEPTTSPSGGEKH